MQLVVKATGADKAGDEGTGADDGTSVDKAGKEAIGNDDDGAGDKLTGTHSYITSVSWLWSMGGACRVYDSAWIYYRSTQIPPTIPATKLIE